MNKDAQGISVYAGEELDTEDIRLKSLFDEIKKNQLTFLDEAGKRIIELATGRLGLFFAFTVFGKDFPPLYLKAHPANQALAALALLFGALTVQPRRYDNYETNLTRMRKELDKIVACKSRCMAVLVGALVLGA